MWPGVGALFQFAHSTKSGQESRSLMAKLTMSTRHFSPSGEDGNEELKLEKRKGELLEKKREGGGLDVHFNNGTHPAFLRNITATGNSHVCTSALYVCILHMDVKTPRFLPRQQHKLIIRAENSVGMRRPGKHSASPLSSSAAASTAKTTNVVSKTGYKMTWKNAVLKIGKQKLAGPVADSPEDRKSGKTTVIAMIDDDSSRAHPSKSLLSRKKSVSKMGKRSRTSFFDAPQTKIAKRFVSSVKSDIEMSPNSEINDGERSDSSTYEIANRNDFTLNSSTSSVSSPIVAQPYTCNEEEQMGKDETEPFVGSSVSSQLCSCLAATQSSAALHGSNKGIGNLNEETENLLEENGMLECSTITNSNRELNEEEKHMILVDFDAGMLPHEIEEKYGVSKLQIADVLSNRISIFRTNWSDLFTLKRRRTVYVRLNMQMWNYFCQCRDQKIWLNGRQLKEQALKIAHELGKFRHLEGLYKQRNSGFYFELFLLAAEETNLKEFKETTACLHSFKASEGWLDSFKRRHCIDLKAMTGKPVIYEADPEDANSIMHKSNQKYPFKIYTSNLSCLRLFASRSFLEIQILSARSTTPSPKLTRDTNSLSTVLDANKFLMDAADAAVLASADRSDSGIVVGSPTQATVAIGTTSPLDIQRLLPGPSAVNEQNLLLSTVHASEIGASSVQALLETCCYRVNEIEVAQAIDTLRAYIVSNNINLLPVLVELQKSLAAIAAQRRTAEKMSSGI
ncbi:unnamed protein product [Brugia pahangi]|uniref:HTH CENPB-type domain-containing protein n=1 Tax=Brugia pahangi TaxID=6280 RepID=A0A0N4TIU6_BRUPA|nr:unnamed protein product [Brugia pahangi]